MSRGFFQVRRIRDHRCLRPRYVSAVVMCLLVWPRKKRYIYLDAVELRFLCAKIIRKLSSINVEEPEMDIDILDLPAETQERIS